MKQFRESATLVPCQRWLSFFSLGLALMISIVLILRCGIPDDGCGSDASHILKRTRLFILGICFCACLTPAFALDQPLPPLNLTIKDLTPKFLAFYDEAKKENALPDRRWEIWKKDYNFAAIPPTSEGQQIARKLLDEAWSRYPAVLDRIRAGASEMTPDPNRTVRSTAELLRPEKPVNITLIVYVGGFENNAFTAAQDGKINVAVPIESDTDWRALHMTHELTHGVHISMGSFSGGWIRSIGTTVLTEGLAMRVTQKLIPGRDEASYVEAQRGWFKEASEKRPEILKAILPVLSSDKSEDVMRFTMGKGPNGLEREAYYVGWLVVGYWIENGMTFADIARIPEKEMPQRLSEVIEKLLTQ